VDDVDEASEVDDDEVVDIDIGQLLNRADGTGGRGAHVVFIPAGGEGGVEHDVGGRGGLGAIRKDAGGSVDEGVTRDGDDFDALSIGRYVQQHRGVGAHPIFGGGAVLLVHVALRSEEHTSELQS